MFANRTRRVHRDWKCIAVDFDHTLARLDDPGYVKLFAIFGERGVPEEVTKSSYKEVKALNGFSIMNLMDQVSGKVNFALDRGAIQEEFSRYLKKNLLLYPDTLRAVREWRSLGIPVVIVTAGEASYQREKVEATGIPHDKLLTIPRAREKASIIHGLLAEHGHPLLVLDDKASELEALHENGLGENEVTLVRVRRRDSPYFHEEMSYPHLEVEHLTDDALVKLIAVTV